MEQITFENNWKFLFEQIDLRKFNDFFHCEKARVKGKNSRRDVYVLEVNHAFPSKTLYIKRYHKPHIKDIISASFHAGWLSSQAKREWDNINFLLKNKIGTCNCVCFGEKTTISFGRHRFGSRGQSYK